MDCADARHGRESRVALRRCDSEYTCGSALEMVRKEATNTQQRSRRVHLPHLQRKRLNEKVKRPKAHAGTATPLPSSLLRQSVLLARLVQHAIDARELANRRHLDGCSKGVPRAERVGAQAATRYTKMCPTHWTVHTVGNATLVKDLSPQVFIL